MPLLGILLLYHSDRNRIQYIVFHISLWWWLSWFWGFMKTTSDYPYQDRNEIRALLLVKFTFSNSFYLEALKSENSAHGDSYKKNISYIFSIICNMIISLIVCIHLNNDKTWVLTLFYSITHMIFWIYHPTSFESKPTIHIVQAFIIFHFYHHAWSSSCVGLFVNPWTASPPGSTLSLGLSSKNTGVGSQSGLRGSFLTQDETLVSCVQADSFTSRSRSLLSLQSYSPAVHSQIPIICLSTWLWRVVLNVGRRVLSIRDISQCLL